MFIDPLPEPGTPSVCMDVDTPPNVAVPASAAMDSESEFVVTSITDCRFRGRRLELLAHFRGFKDPEWISWDAVHDGGSVINEAVVAFANEQRTRPDKPHALQTLISRVDAILKQS